jgi:16S rRNA (guanine966-N2)-methyltransferase
MRVISGQFRGRRLKGPKGFELRPTGDRLKEALFNILNPYLAGATMIDFFSGTGAIGIEALSRGTEQVVLVERDPAAVALIRHNLDLCGIGGGFRIIQDDVFPTLRSLIRQDFKTDIMFFDPPYDWQPYEDLLKLAFRTELASSHTIAAIEHARRAGLPESGETFDRYRIVRQGDKCLSFYKQIPSKV